jgi:hypothetical protein
MFRDCRFLIADFVNGKQGRNAQDVLEQAGNRVRH